MSLLGTEASKPPSLLSAKPIRPKLPLMQKVHEDYLLTPKLMRGRGGFGETNSLKTNAIWFYPYCKAPNSLLAVLVGTGSLSVRPVRWKALRYENAHRVLST